MTSSGKCPSRHAAAFPIAAALAILVAGILALPLTVIAQAAESANAGRAFVSVGGGGSGFYLQYGGRKNLGLTAWVDADTIRHFGFEGEARWLEYHQTANVHVETYLIGGRYHFDVGRTQPYVKALLGDGHFNFPYNYAYGNYLVIAPGGGVDYRLSRRWSARADFEYQDWPQFTYGAMSSVGGTLGLRYSIF